MSANPQPQPITEADYLLLAPEEGVRYEYIDGELYAMTGGSRNHADIVTALLVTLETRFEGRPCRAYVPDLRVSYDTHRNYYYPDVTVVCGEPQFVPGLSIATLTNPTVFVEVLSPSTENLDRGVKWAGYQRIPSLRAYLLVSQDQPRVEQFARNGDDPTAGWLYEDYTGLDASLTVAALGFTLPLATIYRRVTFAAPDADTAQTP